MPFVFGSVPLQTASLHKGILFFVRYIFTLHTVLVDFKRVGNRQNTSISKSQQLKGQGPSSKNPVFIKWPKEIFETITTTNSEIFQHHFKLKSIKSMKYDNNKLVDEGPSYSQKILILQMKFVYLQFFNFPNMLNHLRN